MPGGLEQGMGDCIQTDVLNNVKFLENSEVYSLNNGDQVYKVG